MLISFLGCRFDGQRGAAIADNSGASLSVQSSVFNNVGAAVWKNSGNISMYNVDIRARGDAILRSPSVAPVIMHDVDIVDRECEIEAHRLLNEFRRKFSIPASVSTAELRDLNNALAGKNRYQRETILRKRYADLYQMIKRMSAAERISTAAGIGYFVELLARLFAE